MGGRPEFVAALGPSGVLYVAITVMLIVAAFLETRTLRSLSEGVQLPQNLDWEQMRARAQAALKRSGGAA